MITPTYNEPIERIYERFTSWCYKKHNKDISKLHGNDLDKALCIIDLMIKLKSINVSFCEMRNGYNNLNKYKTQLIWRLKLSSRCRELMHEAVVCHRMLIKVAYGDDKLDIRSKRCSVILKEYGIDNVGKLLDVGSKEVARIDGIDKKMFLSIANYLDTRYNILIW